MRGDLLGLPIESSFRYRGGDATARIHGCRLPYRDHYRGSSFRRTQQLCATCLCSYIGIQSSNRYESPPTNVFVFITFAEGDMTETFLPPVSVLHPDFTWHTPPTIEQLRKRLASAPATPRLRRVAPVWVQRIVGFFHKQLKYVSA
jgi:hypothetical protein